jgi:hypothetical protein
MAGATSNRQTRLSIQQSAHLLLFFRALLVFRKIPLFVSQNNLKHISSRIPIAFKNQQKSRPAENIA